MCPKCGSNNYRVFSIDSQIYMHKDNSRECFNCGHEW